MFPSKAIRPCRKVFENLKIEEFSGLQIRREILRSQPYHDPIFQISFGQFLTSFTYCRKKACGTALAKSLPVYVRFPGPVVVEITASEHLSPRRSTTCVVGTRENETFSTSRAEGCLPHRCLGGCPSSSSISHSATGVSWLLSQLRGWQGTRSALHHYRIPSARGDA